MIFFIRTYSVVALEGNNSLGNNRGKHSQQLCVYFSLSRADQDGSHMKCSVFFLIVQINTCVHDIDRAVATTEGTEVMFCRNVEVLAI